MSEELRREVRHARFVNPESIAERARERLRPGGLAPDHRLLIIAADHPARGALGVGQDPSAMANRYDLLERLQAALAVPGVSGVLAAPDVVEDLLLLNALDHKMVFGSMNRGGLPGAVFEMDDRFTAYDTQSIVDMGLEGGKMLLRINPEDAGTVTTLEACGRAVAELASARRIAMIEPFMSSRVNGRSQNDLTPDAVIRSMAIASALGPTSAYTWLKIPVVSDMERVAEATTLPLVLLGGEKSEYPDAMYERWSQALQLPGVRGLAVGRNLLYPSDDDIEAAIKTALSLL